jgi:hypothetical protein
VTARVALDRSQRNEALHERTRSATVGDRVYI